MEKKIRKDILSRLLEKRLFLQSIWGQMTKDRYDHPVYEIYDGLQRYTTMFLIYDSIRLECKSRKMDDSFDKRLQPSFLLFPSEKSQKEWDEAVDYGREKFSINVEKKSLQVDRP